MLPPRWTALLNLEYCMPLSLYTVGLFWGAIGTGLISTSVTTVWSWLTGYGVVAAPCVCNCDCAGASEGVLALLQSQFDRCGPESLQRPCPPWPYWGQILFTNIDVLVTLLGLAFAGGIYVGRFKFSSEPPSLAL